MSKPSKEYMRSKVFFFVYEVKDVPYFWRDSVEFNIQQFSSSKRQPHTFENIIFTVLKGHIS